jgi:glycosyltransferase involved in cell wall biosynthesis
MSSKGNSASQIPKVSVVTITYNQDKYVAQTLDGFIEQETDFPYEVVVADDCSTDKTPEIIAKYASKYPHIFRVLPRKNNMGSWENFVDALKHTKGEYIALCEGDDYWTDPKKLQLQADFLDSHKDYVINFHLVDVFFEGKPEERSIFPAENSRSDFSTMALLKGNFIQTNSVMYRRQDYSNLPDSVTPGDWYLHLYHAQFGKIGFIGKVMSAYRRHEGGLWWAKNRQDFWKKNGLKQLDMYGKVLELYGSQPEYVKAIQEPIDMAFEAIAGLSKDAGNDYILKALLSFPGMAANFIRDFKASSDQRTKDLESLLNSTNEHVKKLDAVVIEQKEHIRSTERLLQDIRTSKTYRVVNAVGNVKKGLRK